VRQVGILIFDDVEVLDFAGPFEVFSATATGDGGSTTTPRPFNVSLIGLGPDPVRTVGGMQVLPRWHGEAVARATAKQMEYQYTDSNARRVDLALV
jgi:putative intracellular protease/amidase